MPRFGWNVGDGSAAFPKWGERGTEEVAERRSQAPNRHWNRVVSSAINLDDRNDEFHAWDILCFDKGMRNLGSRFVVAALGRVVGR